MSIVHKCDICGSIYEKNHSGLDHDYYTLRHILSAVDEKSVDMCEKCFNKLQDWVINGVDLTEEDKPESDWYSYESTGG